MHGILFIRIPTASEKKQAIDVAYHFFTNERDYPLEGRRAAAERVCVPLMRSCDEVALREFFLDHVGEIMTVIGTSLSKVHKYTVYIFCTLYLTLSDYMHFVSCVTNSPL